MEEQGLVRRVTSETDARAAHVWLTAAGREMARRIRAGAAALDERMLEGVSRADREATLRTLRHIAELDDEVLDMTRDEASDDK